LALFYLDASALVRLLREEPQSPALRSFLAAVALSPLDAFVSYDERQSAAARLAGLRTVAPGS